MSSKLLHTAIKDVVNYYNFFSYAPSQSEIHHFLNYEADQAHVSQTIQELLAKKKLAEIVMPQREGKRFIIPPIGISKDLILSRRSIAQSKLIYIGQYMRCLAGVSAIRLVGISGSLSMMQADKHDDIDIFVITTGGRMWTARFAAVFFAIILGLKRSRGVKNAPNKVCLNLFFDERELSVPKHKRNVYTAHEVIQMKPVIVKGDIYERFIRANKWVREFFPNIERNNWLDIHFLSSSGPARSAFGGTAHVPSRKKTISTPFLCSIFHNLLSIIHFLSSIFHPLSLLIEIILMRLQIYLINRHKTTEIVTPNQLWFFPQDFEKKLRKKGLLEK